VILQMPHTSAAGSAPDLARFATAWAMQRRASMSRVIRVQLFLALAVAGGLTACVDETESASTSSLQEGRGHRGEARHAEHVQRLIEHLDADGDGVIARAELEAAPHKPPFDFDAADTDHDGALSSDELLAAMPKHPPRGRHHQPEGEPVEPAQGR